MRRLLLLMTVVVAPAAAAPAATATTSTTTTTAVGPALSARVTACTTGLAPADRAATFRGAMPAAPGSRTMQMRFVLLQRRGSTGTFTMIVVPEWGAWETSDPGRTGFVFTKRIESLLAPAGYRAAIYFRWLDRHGRVLRMVRRTTGACEQPDLRPDLTFAALDGVRRPDGTAEYTVAVADDGRSAVDPFTVTLAFGGSVQATVPFGPLDAGARATGTVVAPACAAGDTVTVTVDAGGAVDERDEADNVVTRPCPLR